MSLRRVSSHSHRLFETACRIACASIFACTSLIAQAGTDQYSFSGAEGSVYGTYSTSDGCTTGSLSLNPAAQGAHSLNPQNLTSSFVYADISGFNVCTQAQFFGFGSASTSAFSAPGNGSQLPQSITAAGQVPMTYYYFDSNFNFIATVTDSLTFQTTLNKTGRVTRTVETVQETFNTVIRHTDFDGTSSSAIASLTVSTQNLGALTVPNLFGQVQTSRVHQVTIQH